MGKLLVFRPNGQCVVDVQHVLHRCVFFGELLDKKNKIYQASEHLKIPVDKIHELYPFYDSRVVERHSHSVAVSVVGMNHLCDRVVGGICSQGILMFIQMNSSQLDVCRDISEVDGERAFLKNGS